MFYYICKNRKLSNNSTYGIEVQTPYSHPNYKVGTFVHFSISEFSKRKKHVEFQLPSIRKQESIYINQYVTHPTGSGNTQYTSIIDSFVELSRLYPYRVLYIQLLKDHLYEKDNHTFNNLTGADTFCFLYNKIQKYIERCGFVRVTVYFEQTYIKDEELYG